MKHLKLYRIISLNAKLSLNYWKCVAFSADNCNTNLGGLKRASENNVFRKLNLKLKRNLIGIGCPLHITSNAAKIGFD